MPFLGVLPERRALFQPEPERPVAVNDAAAWRLNPDHRRVYDKLAVALDQGLVAAPCGVSPLDLGLAPSAPLFVKPITNLAGMSLGAGRCRAGQIGEPGNCPPGHFWCEYLRGAQTSSDCLVLDGQPLWYAHTAAAAQRNRQRPLWWRVGVPLAELEPALARWVTAWLPGYTGICNLEMIGGRVIEAHLRGSNGFFDLYGDGFIASWVALVDQRRWQPPPALPGGCVASLFGSGPIPADADRVAASYRVSVTPDPHSDDRVAIVRGRDPDAVLAALAALAPDRDPAGDASD